MITFPRLVVQPVTSAFRGNLFKRLNAFAQHLHNLSFGQNVQLLHRGAMFGLALTNADHPFVIAADRPHGHTAIAILVHHRYRYATFNEYS